MSNEVIPKFIPATRREARGLDTCADGGHSTASRERGVSACRYFAARSFAAATVDMNRSTCSSTKMSPGTSGRVR